VAIHVRTCRSLDEYRAALVVIGHYFGWAPTAEDAERFEKQLPADRLHVAFDGSAIVGGAGAFPLVVTVPGGSAPCAGVTVVAVLPTHRRRGLLTRMMGAQLADVRERGEPLAALWASDEQIYGRFGYGLSFLSLALRLPREWAQLRPGLPGRSGTVRLVDHEAAMRALPAIYDRARPGRPGVVARSRSWWEERILDDGEIRRRGAGPLNRAVLELDGRPCGYALYRIKRDFAGDFRGTVRVLEAVGVDGAATREVWRYLFGIDWMEELTAVRLPVDHPLLLQIARLTRLDLELEDGLWLRPVDVAAALSARGYAGNGRVTLDVTADPLFADNVGTWTIEDGAVRRSRRRPDVRLDVQALGSAYLGGFSFAELARAELVEEASRGGLARADALFRTQAAPWCPENF
jgi:predicted acetyltransferase